VLVVNRFRVEEAQADSFRDDLADAVHALAERPGFAGSDAGRNLDEPGLWVLVTRWADVGSYRRALSAYDVKVALAAIQPHALDEPSAYEPATGELNRNVPR
jgi:quinol monooxygenase YgiN